MLSGRTFGKHLLEIPLMLIIGGLLFSVIWGIYAPMDTRWWVLPAMIVLAILLALILLIIS